MPLLRLPFILLNSFFVNQIQELIRMHEHETNQMQYKFELELTRFKDETEVIILLTFV
jgi:hypothetical protein